MTPDPTPPPPPPDARWSDDGRRHDAGDPDEAFRVPFTVADGFVMVFWSILAQIVVGSVGAAFGVDFDDELALVALIGIIQVVTLGGVLAYLRARGNLNWRLLGPVRPGVRHVFVGAGLGVVALLLVLTTAEFTNRMFGPFPEPEQALLQLEVSDPVTVAIRVVVTVVLAPVVEETVFRSVLFQSIRQRLGVIAAMVISALVFAYVHVELIGNAPATIGLIALGLWLAGSFHRTGTLLVPMTAHATYNGLVLALTAAAAAPATG